MSWRMAACVLMMLTAATPAEPADGDSLPVLYGLRLDNALVSFEAVSTGCTTAASFTLLLEPVSAGTYRLAIRQDQRDRCRMSPHIVTLALDLPAVPEGGQARFLVANQLALPGPLLRSDP